MEPGLSKDVRCALWFKKDGHVNPKRVVRAYKSAAEVLGVKIRRGFRVEEIQYKDGLYVVRAGSSIVKGKKLVLATGAQSKLIGHMLGIDIPVVSVRG